MKLLSKVIFIVLSLAPSCTLGIPDSAKTKAPHFVDISVTSITESSASLSATVSDFAQVVDYSFAVKNISNETFRVIPGIQIGNLFEATVNGLEQDHEYSFSAFIGNGAGFLIESASKSFRTLPRTALSPDDTVDVEDHQFLSWLLYRFDSDSDAYLSYREATYVQEINLNTDNISSFAPLSAFPNLSRIDSGGSRQGDVGLGLISALDLSSNSKLSYLYLPHNQVSKLLLPENVNTLDYIALCTNRLSQIDIRPYKMMRFVDLAYNELQSFDCSGLDYLDELHLDHNPLVNVTLCNKLLRYINLQNTQIRSIDFSGCPNLNIVDCTSCPYLDTIYLAKGQVIGTLSTDGSVKIIHYD